MPEFGYIEQDSLQNHHDRIRELEEQVKDLEHRLIYLEEQESSRARAEHEREMALDFKNAAGLSRAGL